MHGQHREHIPWCRPQDRVKPNLLRIAEAALIFLPSEPHIVHQDEADAALDESRVLVADHLAVGADVPGPLPAVNLRIDITVVVARHAEPRARQRIQTGLGRLQQIDLIVHQISQNYHEIKVFPLSELLMDCFSAIFKLPYPVSLRIPHKSDPKGT